MIIGASIVALALVGGGVAATRLLNKETAQSWGSWRTGSLQAQLVEPVTEKPSKSWTWTTDLAEDEDLWAAADGDVVVVASGDAITRLDDKGEEMWRTELDAALTWPDKGSGHVFVTGSLESQNCTVLDAGTGEELWSMSDAGCAGSMGRGDTLTYRFDDDGGVTYALMDGKGEELWSVTADTAAPNGLSLFSVKGSTVRQTDATGEVVWEQDIALDTDDGAHVSIATTEDFVAVSGVEELVALDLESGKELWREPQLAGYSGVVQAGPHQVAMDNSELSDGASDGSNRTFDDGTRPTSEVIVFARNGIVEQLPLADTDGSLFTAWFSHDGGDYLVDRSQSIVFDDSMKEVLTFSADLIAVKDGFYAYDINEGTLRRLAVDGQEEWSAVVTQPMDDADYVSTQVLPLDQKVLTIVGDTVTAYE